MDDRVRKFRQATQRHNRGRSAKGYRYPLELREEAVLYADSRRLQGEPMLAIARDLGIPSQTLVRWAQERRRPAFRRVETVSPDPPQNTPGPPVHMIVTLPNGVRVEGLDMDALITFLQRIG